MTSGPTTKIRKVRCPKCFLLLPEPPNVPVYACGGCDTQLQAKVCKTDTRNTALNSHETNAAQTNRLIHVSDGELHGSPGFHSSVECSLNQNGGSGQITCSNSNAEQHFILNASNADQSNVSGYDESANDADQLSGLSNGDIENETDGSGSRDLGDDQIANVNLSNGDQNSETDDHGFLEHNAEQPRICSEVYSPTGHGHAENIKKQSPFSREDEEREPNSNRSQPEEVKAEVDAHNESNTISEEPYSRQLDETNGSTSVLTVHQPAQEHILQGYPALSCDEQQEQHQEYFDHCQWFVDPSETTEFINPSSELSDNLVDLSKSPTTRSSRAYYDDSVSSNDGTDYQLHDLQRNLFRKAQKQSRYVASGEKPRKEKYLLNNNHKMQHQLRKESSVFSQKRDDATKTVRFDRDKQLNPEKIYHPNWRRILEDGSSSHVPFYDRNFLAGYQGRGSSHQLHNGHHWKSNISSHEKLLQTEEEKMKLLRMVYELQDQLKTCFLNENADERISARADWNNHQNPMYRSLENLDGENYFYPQHPGRYREGSNWPQQCEYSHLPSSANVTECRQQFDCYCYHGSEDWQSSAQLPQPTLLHTRGSCRIHSGVNHHNAYNSCPPSPQRPVDPEIPLYFHKTKSDDLVGHREYAVHNYKREKQKLVKRHMLPIASAAPFISCSNCLKQLQLPADFLVFNKGCHRLRCGVCRKVHKFSLLGRSHLVPYTPVLKTPQTGEVDEYVDSVDRRHLASSKYEHHRLPLVGPSSCSDKTGEKVSYSDKRNDTSLNAAQNKNKFDAEANESAGPSCSMSKSKKVYSENASLPARGGWPLHQLMGYSSPSQVIYERGGTSGAGSSSYFSAGDISIEEPEQIP